MATTHHFAARLTHRYVDSCSHLDQWGDFLKFKMLAPKMLDLGNGHDDMGSKRMRIIGDKRKDQDLQVQVLRDNLSYGGCSHEYDCCGCWSAYAAVTKVRPGVFTALVRMGRNY